MISNLFKSLRLTIAFCLFFSVFYIFVLWLFAQVAGKSLSGKFLFPADPFYLKDMPEKLQESALPAPE